MDDGFFAALKQDVSQRREWLEVLISAGWDINAPARCPFFCNFSLGKQRKVGTNHKEKRIAMQTYRTGTNIFIDGKNVSADISYYLRSITYEDVLEEETDSVDVELMDKDRLFIGDWMPTRGTSITVEFFREGSYVETLPLGTFEIDEVTCNFPPSTIKVKANSVPQNSELRQTDESAAWENVRLSKIAKDVADAAKVELFFQAKDDPEIKRVEQAERSRLSFLQKICRDYDMSVKFADGKLIICDIEQLENQEPVKTFERNKSTVLRFNATATLNDTYKKAAVKYKDGKTDEIYSAEADDSSKEFGKTLKINQRVSNKADAERLAKKKLRQKNREEFKISLTCVGDFNLLSGNVIELKNFGFWDGKWLINRSRHSLSNSGYETQIEATRCEKMR